MASSTENKAEGEPAADGGRGGGNEGRSSGSFPRQTLAPTPHRVSGLPSHLIWLGVRSLKLLSDTVFEFKGELAFGFII